MAKAVVQLSDRFPKDAKASLSVRAGSVVPVKPEKEMTVGSDGVVKFAGCEVGVQYVVHVESADGGWSSDFSVQAKNESFSEDGPLHRHGPEATARRNQADREAQAAAIAAGTRAPHPAPGEPRQPAKKAQRRPNRRTKTAAAKPKRSTGTAKRATKTRK